MLVTIKDGNVWAAPEALPRSGVVEGVGIVEISGIEEEGSAKAGICQPLVPMGREFNVIERLTAVGMDVMVS